MIVKDCDEYQWVKVDVDDQHWKDETSYEDMRFGDDYCWYQRVGDHPIGRIQVYCLEEAEEVPPEEEVQLEEQVAEEDTLEVELPERYIPVVEFAEKYQLGEEVAERDEPEEEEEAEEIEVGQQQDPAGQKKKKTRQKKKKKKNQRGRR